MSYPYAATAVLRYRPPPGSTGQLSLDVGDEITVLALADDEGEWLKGAHGSNGVEGIFPAASVVKVTQGHDGGNDVANTEAGESDLVETNVVEKAPSVVAPPVEPVPISAAAPLPPTISATLTTPLLPKSASISSLSLPASVSNPSPALVSSPASAPSPSSPPTSPKKPSTLRERIAAMNAASSASNDSSPPPIRSKPVFVRKPSLPSAAATTGSIGSDRTERTRAAESMVQSTAGLSASDAQDSIGKGGGSLKDRIAALQGLQLDAPSSLPGRAPKPFKKPSVDVPIIAASDGEVVKSEGAAGDSLPVEPTPPIGTAPLATTSAEPVSSNIPPEPVSETTTSLSSLPLESPSTPSIDQAPLEVRSGGAVIIPPLPKKAGPPRRRLPTPAATSSVVPPVQPIPAATPVIEESEESPRKQVDPLDEPVDEKKEEEAAEEAKVEVMADDRAEVEQSSTVREVEHEETLIPDEEEEHVLTPESDDTHEVSFQSAPDTTPLLRSSPSTEFADSSVIATPIPNAPIAESAPVVIPSPLSNRPPVPSGFVRSTSLASDLLDNLLEGGNESFESDVVSDVAEEEKEEEKDESIVPIPIPNVPKLFVAAPAMPPPTRSVSIPPQSMIEEDKVEGSREETASEDVVKSSNDDGIVAEPEELDEEPVEEDPEIVRRRALADRMAKLGGRSMMPMMMGPPRTKAPSLPPPPLVPESVEEASISPPPPRRAPPVGAFRLPMPSDSSSTPASPVVAKDAVVSPVSSDGTFVPTAHEAESNDIAEDEGEEVVDEEEEEEEEEPAEEAEEENADEEEEDELEEVRPPLPPGRPATLPNPPRSPRSASLPQSQPHLVLGSAIEFNRGPERHSDELTDVPPPPPPRSYPNFSSPTSSRSIPTTQIAEGRGGPDSPTKRSSSTLPPASSSPRNFLGVELTPSSPSDSFMTTLLTDSNPTSPVTVPMDIPSGDQLLLYSLSIGTQIVAAAYSKLNDRSSRISTTEFISFCFSRAMDAAPPVEDEYGVCITKFNPPPGGTAFAPLDDPRAGDVVVFREVKVKHGLGTTKLGAVHVAVATNWDGKKRKLRVIEVEGKGNALHENTYKMEDVKSGVVNVYRVRPQP